ncbi:hypothetical protein FB384_002193 [Prauserella sediminis]|uniref:Uncharacterized protein n=1 Tax=Prauserella sediminis TaxID=577680 RepID=A0A839XN36_9PSEU|nr:hypothetical protein [Prauserella sediminis]MBB3663289.1 hypothetical protein [Prauserella sediminis]
MGSGDGTQAPESAHGYSDSLADADTATDGSGSMIPPAQSTVPDLEVIRNKAAAALAEEDAKQAQQAGSGDAGGTSDADAQDGDSEGGDEETAGTETTGTGTNGVRGRLGKLPRPRMRGQLLPAMLRRGRQSQQAQRPAEAKPVKQPLNQRVTVRKPSNASTGMIVAGVLLIVFVIVAIQFVVSFVESVSSIFS